MYTNRIMQQWDPQSAAVVRDTTYGFYNVFNYSFSVSAQTKLYGFYRPLPFFGGKKIQMIRHVFTPSVSFSAAPDFGSSRYGFWQTYSKIENGKRVDVKYSPFSHGIFGTAPQGKQGTVSFLSLIHICTIKAGEIIQVRKPPVTYSFKVLALTEKRMGAKLVPEYLENVTPQEQYDILEMNRISGFINRSKGLGRPTKREGRKLKKFTEGDFFDDGFDFDFDFDDYEEND